MDEISQAQKNFVDYFIESGNQTEAYKKAYPKCKNDNSAAASASKLLRNNKVKQYLDARMAAVDSDKIATAEDVARAMTETLQDAACPLDLEAVEKQASEDVVAQMEKSFGKRKKSNDFPFPNWKKSSVFPRHRFLTIWKKSSDYRDFP